MPISIKTFYLAAAFEDMGMEDLLHGPLRRRTREISMGALFL